MEGLACPAVEEVVRGVVQKRWCCYDGRLAILRKKFLIEQKYIEDNGSQVSHHHRKGKGWKEH